MKEVGVLIVTYNRLQLLQEEIESIKKQSFRDFDIIVVDNFSTDGTKEWLDLQNDIHSIHINPENIGPARAFVLGMKYIAETGYKYCWLMDDDVECYPDALEKLYQAYQVKKDIGFVCSKVIGMHGEPMNTPTIDTRQTSNGYPSFDELLDKGMLKIVICTFVSMFISCKSIYEEGLPYGEFYNWAVDTEYSRRLSINKECYEIGNSIVIHKRRIQGDLSFETEKDKVRLSYYRSHYRNLIFTLFKYDCLTRKEKTIYILSYCKNLLGLLFRIKIRQFNVKLFSLLDVLTFTPVILFPDKK